MEKKEYIERGVVLEKLRGYSLENPSALGKHSGAVEVAMYAIEQLPAADVAEVVHGEWIHNPKREYDYICSVCYGDAPEDRMRNNAILTPYCPHCGAKMDGKTYTLAEVKAELGLDQMDGGNRNADA